MRFATLFLLTVLAAPAFAQGGIVPDTTAPERYFPLQVGNVWEYDDWQIGIFPFPPMHVGYERWVVTGEADVGGEAYAVLSVSSFASNGARGPVRTRYVRFDTSRAVVLERSGEDEGVFEFLPCELDTPFFPVSECTESAGGAYVYGVGHGQGVLDVTTSVKRFDRIGASYYVAAGIGFVRQAGSDLKGGRDLTLLYARVAGRRHGTPVPVLPVVVSTGPDAASPALALRAAPNPPSGLTTLSLAMPAGGVVTVDAFDTLGRRVYHSTPSLATGTHALDLDTSAWAPGLYVVRATAGGTTAATRVVRR